MILDKKQIQVIFLYKERKWKWSLLAVSGSTWATRLLHPWNFPGKSTGGGAISFSKINGDNLQCQQYIWPSNC